MSVDAKRVQAVFLAAVEATDGAQRSAILDRECLSNPELRRRVEALLRAHADPASILGDDLPSEAATGTFSTENAPASEATGTVGAASGPAGSEETAEQIVRKFLEPSAKSVSLGRIAHYEVLEILGRGGFGIVLRAQDDVLQRVVAVKVLAPDLATTSPARKRFLREARSYAKIRHENVVQVHAVEEQPLPFLVMEFVPGETLKEMIHRIGPLDVPEIVRIGGQIAEGLAAAHETGLIHRDVKPTNVMIESGPPGRVKLTDFGLARTTDDATISQSGLIVGTPSYMAPEQARGSVLDHRADLFSLGSVLYVMCTGRPPFRASGTMAILKRVCDDTPRPIREIIPETPPWLCDLITRLHAKDPAQRYQSAREVAALLRAHQADATAQTGAAGPKHPYGLALAAAVLVVFIGVIAILATRLPSWKRQDAPDDKKTGPLAVAPEAGSKFVAVLNGKPAHLPFPGRTSWFAQDRQGQWLAVPCENQVALYDARTLVPKKLLPAGTERVYQVAFSPNGKHLAVASWSDDDSVTIWDLENGTLSQTLPHRDHCLAVQYSPDGQWLLTVGRDFVPTVWDLSGTEPPKRLPPQNQPVCADAIFTADGKYLVTHIRGGDLQVRNVRTWTEFRTLSGPEPVTEDDPAWLHCPLVCSADGKWLAAGSPTGFKVYASDTWEMKRHVPTPATWLAFAPDGRTIYSAAHENPEQRFHAVAHWETESGKLLKTEPLASRGPWAVYHLLLDGKALLAMTCDPAEPAFHVYDSQTLVEHFLSVPDPNKK